MQINNHYYIALLIDIIIKDIQEYLKQFNFKQIICIKNSYLKL